MRRLFAVVALMVVSAAALGAQDIPGTIDIHPAGIGTRSFTQEEVTLGRVSPAQYSVARWEDGEHFLVRGSAGKVQLVSVSGDVQDYSATPTAAQLALPKGASDVTPSAAGSIAFTLGQSLYIVDADGTNHTVAQSENSQITYGQSVSRNEFGIGEGIYWSDSGAKLAFYRKDESLVTEFPLLDITSRTGSLVSIKYPMNGMDSERISLGIYDCADGSTVYVNADDFGPDRYLTNISWSPDDKYVFIQVLDRSQHHMRLNMYDACSGDFVRTVLTEDNEAWVEPYAHLVFLKGTSQYIYSSDNRDGFKSLYLCDTEGTVRRLTTCDADVEFIAQDGRYVYYSSNEISPAEKHLFRIEIKQNRKQELAKARFGTPQQLTSERGWHNVYISLDCKHFIDTYSSFNVPRVAELRSTDGSLERELFRAADPLAEYHTGEVRFGSIKSADGRYDNHYRLFLPADFDPQKKYPVILYVYGGPHSQMVTDSWLGQVRPWELLMAQKGYIVYIQDNRGTPSHGTDYEKAINRQCGQVEMEDQMVGIDMLRSLPFVDSDRIGVHGWSYGGFMTISLMTNYPDVFKVGVAGGPVIDWKWYEIMYGERYMDTEETNPEGFARTSLIRNAGNLKGKLLICQGAIDNTVVWEHSLSFVQECIEKNIQLDYFPYPRSEHNVAGVWRVHLMDKVTDYFDAWL